MISGRGSNLQALLEAATRPGYPAEIGLVLSNVAEVEGLARAAAAGVETAVVPHRDFADRRSFEKVVSMRLEEAGCSLVAQAGFMRVVTPWFVARWRDRLINIHPSLLPAFPGLDTHARALAAGVRLHGCTVHFVRDEVDQGPIIGQAAVPVLPGDTPEALSRRVLAAEHRLYPRCLALVAAGRTRLDGERVLHDGGAEADAQLIVPAEG
ncbi:MAG: phosphoribosylglycinamide formyltransferase [Tistlia sp.]|uniref:phosphoribosylglycinamide formyltransferase n=1 Tax=Tistlia sp. TaxID=3057121 RepID=UPI0034A5A1C4